MNKIYKILIVDDDSFLLNMYISKFKKSGNEVDYAKGANETLEKLRSGYSPDVVLLDVVLPGMDGFDLLETIRKEKLSPKTRYIMFTNQSEGTEITRAKELNVAGYIVKASVIPSEVVTKVLDIIGSNNE